MNLIHFNIKEFDSPDEPGSGNKMERNFLRKLDKARGIADVTFIISSGYRTINHNVEVGGVNGSSHTLGYAADIKCKDSRKRFRIVASLLSVGFTRIGISKKFIHVDDDPNKDEEVIWMY